MYFIFLKFYMLLQSCIKLIKKELQFEFTFCVHDLFHYEFRRGLSSWEVVNCFGHFLVSSPFFS